MAVAETGEGMSQRIRAPEPMLLQAAIANRPATANAKRASSVRFSAVTVVTAACDVVVRKGAQKRKGCDIGYALAADSCERAGRVETCTIAAPDAITAFAVRAPAAPRESRRFFRVRSPNGSPRPANHPAYFGLTQFSLS